MYATQDVVDLFLVCEFFVDLLHHVKLVVDLSDNLLYSVTLLLYNRSATIRSKWGSGITILLVVHAWTNKRVHYRTPRGWLNRLILQGGPYKRGWHFTSVAMLSDLRLSIAALRPAVNFYRAMHVKCKAVKRRVWPFVTRMYDRGHSAAIGWVCGFLHGQLESTHRVHPSATNGAPTWRIEKKQ